MKKLILLLFLASCSKSEIKPIPSVQEEKTVNKYTAYIYSYYEPVKFEVYKNEVRQGSTNIQVESGDRLRIYIEPQSFINMYNEVAYCESGFNLFLDTKECLLIAGHKIINETFIVP
jgi:hypothetical protein